MAPGLPGPVLGAGGFPVGGEKAGSREGKGKEEKRRESGEGED